MPRLAIIIAVVIILIILLIVTIYYLMQPVQAAPLVQVAQPVVNTNTGAVVKPTTPTTTPTVPTAGTTAGAATSTVPALVKYCVGGGYCNGVPVPANSVAVGGKVCGSGNVFWDCKLVNNAPVWQKSTTVCPTGTYGMCSTTPAPIPTTTPAAYCAGGTYCNGTPVPPSGATVGTTVCGTRTAAQPNGQQHKCILINGKPGWTALNTSCTPGMLNGCLK